MVEGYSIAVQCRVELFSGMVQVEVIFRYHSLHGIPQHREASSCARGKEVLSVRQMASHASDTGSPLGSYYVPGSICSFDGRRIDVDYLSPTELPMHHVRDGGACR